MQRIVFAGLVLLLALVPLAVAGAGKTAADPPAGKGKEDKTDPEEKKLQGTWVIVLSEQDGAKTDDLKGCKFTFAAGKLETDSDGEKGTGKYKIDSSATPKILDITLNVAGPVARLGVYSLDKDTLTIRLAGDDKRPKAVNGSTKDDGCWLLKLEREKK